MLDRLLTYLRYDWPVHFIILLTNWLPDNVVFYRLRGWLVRPFMGSCGKSVNIGRNVMLYNPSKIHLGNLVHITYGSIIMASGQITIEDEVMIGPYCVLASGNHSRAEDSYRFGPDINLPIIIGRGSWLGSHVIVTAGSEIGRASLVAAGAVVRGVFPPNSLLGGVPARVIKELTN